jgi:uncharacterized protein
MRLDVEDQLRQTVGTVVTEPLNEAAICLDNGVLKDISGSVTLLRTDVGLLVLVELSGALHTDCARCLKETALPVTIEFEEEFVPVADPETGAPAPDIESPDTFRIDSDFVLDLHEALRQYSLVSEPPKPLCRADCAGLCTECGLDLNDGPCGCQPPADNRWQALAGLEIAKREGS